MFLDFKCELVGNKWSYKIIDSEEEYEEINNGTIQFISFIFNFYLKRKKTDPSTNIVRNMVLFCKKMFPTNTIGIYNKSCYESINKGEVDEQEFKKYLGCITRELQKC